jgi:hypothetical protein
VRTVELYEERVELLKSSINVVICQHEDVIFLLDFNL